MVQWLCHSPCKPGVAGLIPGFSSPWDGTINRGPSPYDLSCWWDVKPQSTKVTGFVDLNLKFQFIWAILEFISDINFDLS